jgi:hypothetical protein
VQIASQFTIISLLFLKNEISGYVNPAITVRLNNNIEILDYTSSSSSSFTPSIFSTWNIKIPPNYFKKKKTVDSKIKFITSEERKKGRRKS